MPSVAELTALYGNFMLGPRRGASVCDVCLNFTDGYRVCYACGHGQRWLDAVAPISYSVAHEQLHHALWGYKRLDGEPARRLQVELAAVLWRYLATHEACLAHAAGTDTFDLVTIVPSGAIDRDSAHPLRRLTGELVAPTRSRYEPLLERTEANVPEREFSANKFAPVRTEQLRAKSILLVDDTWTTGASAQSAAAALKQAGAATVAAIVIGRHVNREWRDTDRRLRAIALPYDWQRCALCAPAD